MKIIRVVRTLEYVGPEDWVRRTLDNAAIDRQRGPRFLLRDDYSIRELSRTEEEVQPC